MTTFLYSLLTTGSDKMAVTDPHGWTLAIISACVVFSGLIILYIIYSLLGESFSGELKQRFQRKPEANAAARMESMDLDMDIDSTPDPETAAAIAAALHLYLTECTHDMEPGIITISGTGSAWADKSLTLRRKPS